VIVFAFWNFFNWSALITIFIFFYGIRTLFEGHNFWRCCRWWKGGLKLGISCTQLYNIGSTLSCLCSPCF